MQTVTIPLSAGSRPVQIRKRDDLSFTPQWHGGRKHWVVKDPVALTYFHLRDEEYGLLMMLDGQASLNDLREEYERRFAPKRITLDALRAFIAMLHQNGLVVSNSAGQGERLLQRHQRGRKQAFLSAVSNVLAIRFRGVDPERLLRRVSPLSKWLFSGWSLLFAFTIAVSAAVLIAVQYDVLQSRLPSFREFFLGGNLWWLFATLAFTKILHEFGHALACRHFGGECHEIGLMLLVFTPCLYCNVSDSWRLPNKWHRIAVSAAGIYVEVMLDSICAFLWWFSHPGLFNQLCLNIMFVSSVSTVLFNGNPLLRYDGYYILSDLIEVPNLWRRSRAVLRRFLAKWCLGWETGSTEQANRLLLAGYAVASMIYRGFVLVMILWFVYRWTAAHRVEMVGRFFVAAVIAGMLAFPCVAAVQVVNDPRRRRLIRGRRFGLVALIVSLAIIVAVLIPLPHSVKSPAAVRLTDSRPVQAPLDGTILSAVEAGKNVRRNQVLAVLSNREMERQLKRLEGERDRQEKRIDHLTARRLFDPNAAALLPAAKAELTRIEDELAQHRRSMQPLELKSPVDGTVIAPPRRTRRGNTRLAQWTGTPLEPRNRGGLLRRGTLFCLVGDPRKLEAVLLVDEAEVDLVQPGQDVSLVFDQLPGRSIPGTVIEKSPAAGSATLHSLIFSEDRTVTDKPPETEADAAVYSVRVRLQQTPPELLLGSRGTARIKTRPRSLAWRGLRFLRRTFRFDVPRGEP